MKSDNRLFRTIMISPIIIYSVFLILLPMLYIFVISFFKSDSYGGMITAFTLSNYVELFNLAYLKIFLKSMIIAVVTTIICMIIAYPFVLAISHKSKKVQNVLTTLVMVPFLTNSLIRMYGFIVLLRKHGVINSLLLSLNLIEEPLSLMYNNLGIIIGMVYTLLPFMILPLNSSVSMINQRELEAASDLGASKFKIFKNIILPQTYPALFNGSLMVFTPALGYFFIVDVLGGGKIMILGNLIKNQFLTARNWPLGASISICIIVITMLIILVYRKFGGKMEDLG